MLNAILHWLNMGILWRDLPERFGPWQSVYSRFRSWTKAGVWEDILTALIEQDLVDETTLMLDSTTIKVHQHASNVIVAFILWKSTESYSLSVYVPSSFIRLGFRKEFWTTNIATMQMIMAIVVPITLAITITFC